MGDRGKCRPPRAERLRQDANDENARGLIEMTLGPILVELPLLLHESEGSETMAVVNQVGAFIRPFSGGHLAEVFIAHCTPDHAAHKHPLSQHLHHSPIRE
jgi:hypothetical protein